MSSADSQQLLGQHGGPSAPGSILCCSEMSERSHKHTECPSLMAACKGALVQLEIGLQVLQDLQLPAIYWSEAYSQAIGVSSRIFADILHGRGVLVQWLRGGC